MNSIVFIIIKLFNFMGAFYESFFVQPFILDWQEKIEQDMVDYNREMLSKKINNAITALELQTNRLQVANQEDDVYATRLNNRLLDHEQQIVELGQRETREHKRIQQIVDSCKLEYETILSGKSQRYIFIHLNTQTIRILKAKKDTVDNGSIDMRLLGGTQLVDEFIKNVSSTINARDTMESAAVYADLSLRRMPITMSNVKTSVEHNIV
ncbi:ORF81 [white sturgeon herpesvirus 2]|uniref:ORF82 n=2 Tax=root TaxID=1 RepID=F6GQ78_9VIRU|nr:ORF81 [Acipenserid herpesvirus 2]AEF97698.1 ORF81 [Acipenserid herpesvirus 2]